MAEAERQYSEALRLEPTNPTVVSESSHPIHPDLNQLQAVAAAGAAALNQLTDNASLRMVVLQHLLTDAVDRKSLGEALAYSRKITEDPAATFADKIEYLHLMRLAKNGDYAPWLASLKQTAASSCRRILMRWDAG